ncbi:MAG: nucleotidyltransferase domain-containing protein [Deltaproteobacteria bacterium]|nr:nucleotidyltransferase domain-containing protein [Deltaproteobacteria bacterium]
MDSTTPYIYPGKSVFEKEREIKKCLLNFPEVKVVYLFGSRARKEESPMSDYDFAIYCSSDEKKNFFETKFLLMDELGRIFQTDKIDIVLLNNVKSPEIKYKIITEGLLIHEVKPFRILLESRIFSDFFDFHLMLKRNGLTRAEYIPMCHISKSGKITFLDDLKDCVIPFLDE